MIVEIHGASFFNIGSELMLRTVIFELTKRITNIQFAVDPTVGSYEERAKLNLKQIVPMRFWMTQSRYRPLSLIQKLSGPIIPKRISAHYGCVTVNQINALIDISGFAYSDKWGPKPIQSFSYLTKLYKKSGKPVILLPQAFGPFDMIESKNGFKKIVRYGNLIYARDFRSYQHIKKLIGINDKVRIAPDITYFYPEGTNSASSIYRSPYCCLIPNSRILDKSNKVMKGNYLNLLCRIAGEILNQSLQVRILVHDKTNEDLEIAKQILANLKSEKPNNNILIENPTDPLEAKRRIGSSRFIVGSRYHALISAFSYGVPSLCIGWAHKYDAIYEEFNLTKFLIDENTPYQNILCLLEELLDEGKNRYYGRLIKNTLIEKKKVTQLMWNDVETELEKYNN